MLPNYEMMGRYGANLYENIKAKSARGINAIGNWGTGAVTGGGSITGAFRKGVAEGMGFMSIDVGGKKVSGGWMGRDMFSATAYQSSYNETYSKFRKAKMSKSAANRMAHMTAEGAGKGMSGSWKYTMGRVGQEAKLATRSLSNASRFAKGAAPVAMRMLGPAFTAMAAYEGYREGGLMGAAVAGGKEIAIWGAMEAGLHVLGGITMGATAVGGGLAVAGLGMYAYGKGRGEFKKGLERMEMGAPVVDTFGTIATTRQRSLAALNLSHINGRQALGNEASLMHLSVAR